MDMEGNQ
jgi:hypothetical protein